MFKSVIFWCEFPNKLDFKKLKDINFPCKIYFASKTKKEFFKYKNKVNNKNIEVGVWPILSKKEGYWFSSFSSKRAIDKLNEFRKIPMKIDIEPPLPDFKFRYFKFILYLLKYSFKQGENYSYLNDTIYKLLKDTDIILSTYPFPYFILKNYGLNKTLNVKFNYFLYPIIFPKILRWKLWLYYKHLIKRNLDCYFGIGLISEGIFTKEPIYKSLDKFKKDIDKFYKLNVKNLVVYSIEGILNKEDYKEWLNAI